MRYLFEAGDKLNIRKLPDIVWIAGMQGGPQQVVQGSLELWSSTAMFSPYNQVTRFLNKDGCEVFLAGWPTMTRSAPAPPLDVQAGRAIDPEPSSDS